MADCSCRWQHGTQYYGPSKSPGGSIGVGFSHSETYQTTVLWPKSDVVYRHAFPDSQFGIGPGTYKIQAHLPEIPPVQGERLESNIVTVEVREPQGQEQTALALFQRRDGDTSAEWYRSFMEKYPHSAYTPQTRLIVGRLQLERGQYDEAISTLFGSLSSFLAPRLCQ